MTKVKEKLKDCRTEENKLQREVAEYLNVTQSTYSKWEQGVAEPNFDQLVCIANLYNVTTDYLLDRESDIGLIATNANLTTSEEQLLYYFRKLDEDMKNTVLDVAKIASNSNDKSIIKPQKIS